MISIESFLQSKGINNFELVSTSSSPVEDSKRYGISLSNLIKALLVNIDETFVVFLVPMDQKLDFEELKNRFKAQNVRMATRDEVLLITGYRVGNVPPFNLQSDVKVYIEKGFEEDGEVLASAGLDDTLVKMAYHDLAMILQS